MREGRSRNLPRAAKHKPEPYITWVDSAGPGLPQLCADIAQTPRDSTQGRQTEGLMHISPLPSRAVLVPPHPMTPHGCQRGGLGCTPAVLPPRLCPGLCL